MLVVFHSFNRGKKKKKTTTTVEETQNFIIFIYNPSFRLKYASNYLRYRCICRLKIERLLKKKKNQGPFITTEMLIFISRKVREAPSEMFSFEVELKRMPLLS